MNLEGTQCVLIVGSGEDDRHLSAYELQHFEAVQLRHLDVQEEQIRLQFGDRLHGFKSISTLGDDLYFRVLGQKLTYHLTREIFVVDDDRPNLSSWLHHAGTAFLSAGSTKPTWKRWGSFSTEKLARVP